MRVHLIGLSFLAVVSNSFAADAAPELAPQIFAPGVISGPGNDWTPTFSPDGKRLEFTRSGIGVSLILESEFKGGRWSEPTLASYSGEWPDSSPAEAPDGSYLVFESERPATAALAAEARAKHLAIKGSALWKVSRQGEGWGEPVRLPEAVNITGNMWKPSVDAAGDLYFISKNDGEKNLHLYRSLYKDGAYQPAEALPFSDGRTLDVDPAIAPDGSYLIFSSAGRGPIQDDHEHLYIVFAQNGGWGKVLPLCFKGADDKNMTLDDDANVGPDGATLYFSSDRVLPMHLAHTRAEAEQLLEEVKGWDNGNANVWTLPLKPWLDAQRSGTPMPACPGAAG